MKLLAQILVLFALTMVACGDDKDANNANVNNANNANNSADAGMDQEADTAPEFVCPNEGELVCDDRCLNVQYSMEDCGACNNACHVGTMTCSGGACECLGERTMCNERCVTTDANREHCGECNNTCEISEACVAGGCVLVSEREEVTGVLLHTNDTRAENQDCGEHGPKSAVGGLQLNDLLMIAAQGHAEDMAENMFMEHEGSDGSSPSERARRADYAGRLVGENIARGYRTPEEVVLAWLKSDGHCKNMMNGSYVEIGIGYAVASDGEFFWVQLFGAP